MIKDIIVIPTPATIPYKKYSIFLVCFSFFSVISYSVRWGVLSTILSIPILSSFVVLLLLVFLAEFILLGVSSFVWIPFCFIIFLPFQLPHPAYVPIHFLHSSNHLMVLCW